MNRLQGRRRHRLTAVAACAASVACFGAVLRAQEDGSAKPPAAEGAPESSTLLPPVLEGVRQRLGGSVVEQVPGLWNDSPAVNPSTEAEGKGNRQRRERIEALRDAAWQLDTAAHRLERLELYAQADALREQAQRLRLDARGMMDRGAAAEADR